MPHDVFISHSTKDKPVADAVCAALENAQVRCWIAPRDVQPGRSFAGEITRAVQNSQAMVLIFSTHSNNSEQVLREVQLAVKNHLHIVQFRIERVVPSDDFAYFLSTPHWLDALTPPLEAHVQRLTAAITTLLAAPAEPAQALPSSTRLAPAVTLRQGEIPSWPRATSSLWKNHKLLVLAVAFVVVFLAGWWLTRVSRQAAPPSITQNTPVSVPPIVPQQRPQTTTQFSAETPTWTVPPDAPDWIRDQMPASVAAQNEIPVRRRFVLPHEEAVNDASFSPDSKLIVTASTDKSAQIWDAQTGKPVGGPLKHESEVKKATFTPDGRRIMTVSNDVRVWDAETQQEIGGPLGTNDLTTASLSPDGKRIAIMENQKSSGRNDRGEPWWASEYQTRIWNTETRALVGGTIHTKEYTGEHILVFSGDNKRILTNAGENTARVWDVESGEAIGDILRHKGEVTAACFSPDTKTVATWAHGTKVRVWNVDTGEQLWELKTEDAGYRSSVAFSPDGKYISAVRTENYPALIFEAKTGNLHGRPLPYQAPPSAFSPDSKRIAVVSSSSNVVMWDVETTQLVTKPLEHDGDINGISFSPNGKSLVVASQDHTARVWEIGQR